VCRVRWPDGRFYLLDRDYQVWRRHRIAFTREELADIGLDQWERRQHQQDLVPLELDGFRARVQLRPYAKLIERLADTFSVRAVHMLPEAAP
jgi:hypothetical protein